MSASEVFQVRRMLALCDISGRYLPSPEELEAAAGAANSIRENGCTCGQCEVTKAQIDNLYATAALLCAAAEFRTALENYYKTCG